MLRILARLVADTLVIATVVFVAAGTIDWRRGWVLLAVLFVVRTLSAIAVFRVNPALLRERATVLVHRNQPWTDKLILGAFMISGFVGVPGIATLDIFRWHLLPSPPRALGAIGLVLFATGCVIIGLALRENAFAVTVVRAQRERDHRVVDSGVYRIVRHPMYAANLLVNVGLALWLGSYAGTLFAAVPLGLLLLRIELEERFLRRELPGYPEYAARVPYRVVPGVW